MKLHHESRSSLLGVKGIWLRDPAELEQDALAMAAGFVGEHRGPGSNRLRQVTSRITP